MHVIAPLNGSDRVSVLTSRQRLRKWMVWINCILLGCGILFGAWLLPRASMKQAPSRSGWGGASGAFVLPQGSPLLSQKICGYPAHVFQQFGFPTQDVPSKTALMQLPTSQKQPVRQSGDLSYDPKTDTLCTVGWVGIYTRYVQQQSNGANSNPPSPSDGSVASSMSTGWVQGILTGLFGSFAQGLGDFFHGILSWAQTFGFMFITPAGLTYNQPVVSHLNAWMVGVMDSLLVLVLIVGGYTTLLGHQHIFRELAPRLILAAIAGTGSLFFLSQCIELQNALCTGFLGALATAGIGNLSLPLGAINWATAPVYEIVTYLIDLLMSVLLCLQMLVRLGLLDFLLLVAPLGFLCFALPQTLAWGRLWVQAFVSTLLLQFFQTVCIGLGSALIGSFGHASLSVISILVGIATLYIAVKLPGMLLSNVLRASVGEVHRDAGHAVQTAAEYMALKAA